MNLKSIPKTFIIVFSVTNIFTLNANWVNDEKCGLKPPKNFIVGGSDAEENEFPFMVSLQFKGDHFCGGTLINDRFILTAAHCLDAIHSYGMKATNITARIGNSDIGFLKGSKSYECDHWVIHECYAQRDLLSDDIALLKLKESVKIDGKTVGTVCLPPKGQSPEANLTMILIGWGVMTETSSTESEKAVTRLQKTQTNIVSEEFCEYYFYYKNIGIMGVIWIRGKRLCFRGNTTACRGDSGGPAFQEKSGRYYQMGVTSFGPVTIPAWNTCIKTTTDWYTKVSEYVDWIAFNVKNFGQKSRDSSNSKCI